MAGEAGIIAWTYAQTGSRGYRHGKRSPLLIAVDWTPYLDRPIDEVRESLGLERARPYPVFHMVDAPGAPDELPA